MGGVLLVAVAAGASLPMQPVVVNTATVSDLQSVCFQLHLKPGEICARCLCKCLIYNPKFWPFKEAGVEVLCSVGFLSCSPSGCSAAVPRSLLSGTSAEPGST